MVSTKFWIELSGFFQFLGPNWFYRVEPGLNQGSPLIVLVLKGTFIFLQ